MKAFNLQDINEHLAAAGIKPSPQRVAIMSFLIENPIHPTVDEIFSHLSSSYPTLSRTTVYNTLWLLVEKGVIASLDIDRTNSRFDYTTHPHAHFRCRECGQILDVPLSEASSTLPDKALHIENVSIYYKGLCDSCFQKAQNN